MPKIRGLKKVSKKVEKASKEFLFLISKDLNIKQITNFRKTSIQNSYRLLNRLLERGLIRKIDTTISITEKGLKFLAGSTKVEYPFVRVNNLKFKVRVLNPADYFNKIPKVLIKRSYRKVALNNNVQYVFSYRNIKIITTTKSFIFCMPNIYAKTSINGFDKALHLLLDTIPYIENMFKVILIKDRYANIEIISQEYALLENELAKKYRIENNRLHVYDKKGKLWLVADYSFRVDELETVARTSALEDNQTVQSFFNDLRNSPATLSDMKKEYYHAFSQLAKQIQAHLTVVKEMKGLIKVLKEKETKKC